MKKSAGPMEIYIGDVWVYRTNTGGISRTITHIDGERVYYRGYGDPYEQSCLLSTFRRWWRGASLDYAGPDRVRYEQATREVAHQLKGMALANALRAAK